MSTLAIEGSSPAGTPSRLDLALRYADLAVLGLALPLFLLLGASMLGYAVAGGAWLAQRGLQLYAERRAMGSGERRNALAILAGAILLRLWVLAVAILLVGTLGNRDAGLAAAVLALVLVTVSLGTRALAQVVDPAKPPAGRPR